LELKESFRGSLNNVSLYREAIGWVNERSDIGCFFVRLEDVKAGGIQKMHKPAEAGWKDK
jgi:hypothetical protein